MKNKCHKWDGIYVRIKNNVRIKKGTGHLFFPYRILLILICKIQISLFISRLTLVT